MESEFVHIYIDTSCDEDSDNMILTETKEEALVMLFDELLDTIRACHGRIFWRALPKAEYIEGFNPPVKGWKGVARFSIEPGVEGAGVMRENDPSKYPYLSFMGLSK